MRTMSDYFAIKTYPQHLQTCTGTPQWSALECGDIHGPTDGPYGGMLLPGRYCSDMTWLT